MKHGCNGLAIVLSLTGLAASAAAQPEPTAEPLAAAPVAAAPAAPTVEPEVEVAGYDKGFFLRSRDGNNLLKLGGRAQLLFSGSSRDNGEERVENGAFSIARLRLTMEGHVHSTRIGYKIQTDFGKGFVTLKDAILDLELVDGVYLRGGQWKRPFSRQQITSSGRLELVDRAITDTITDSPHDAHPVEVPFCIHSLASSSFS
jgi:phosphate-selective porin